MEINFLRGGTSMATGMKKSVRAAVWFFVLALAAGTVLTCGTGDIGVGDADSILKKIGFPRGICVLLGDNDCALAIDLARKSHLTFYVQVLRSEDADRCRRSADAAGLYGSRIFVDAGAFSRIHLADNIADAFVAVGPASSIFEEEALRVVRPQGTVLIGRKERKKPIPDGVDDWSHPYHGPDNNPQSNAPYLTQFLALPYYAPLPQLTVSAAGRLFRATDHIAFKPREKPNFEQRKARTSRKDSSGLSANKSFSFFVSFVFFVVNSFSIFCITRLLRSMVLAMNPGNGRVIWSYSGGEPIDSRAVCIKNGRMFLCIFASLRLCIFASYSI